MRMRSEQRDRIIISCEQLYKSQTNSYPEHWRSKRGGGGTHSLLQVASVPTQKFPKGADRYQYGRRYMHINILNLKKMFKF